MLGVDPDRRAAAAGWLEPGWDLLPYREFYGRPLSVMELGVWEEREKPLGAAYFVSRLAASPNANDVGET